MPTANLTSDMPAPATEFSRGRFDEGAGKIAISGATGLVGSALANFLSHAGHDVRRIVRQMAGSPATGHPPRTGAGASGQPFFQALPRDIAWDPAGGKFDLEKLEGCRAVVHLAGENIAAGRWTARRKEAIRSSRVDGTRQLCEALAKLRHKPEVLVAASAVGYYGSRGDQRLDESSECGQGFLAETCRAWEEATQAAARAGVRVVNLRIGLVLTARGGVLKKLLTPFRLGLGGPVGGGRQGMSWIALDDLVAAIHFAIVQQKVRGAVNATSPQPLANREFGRELANSLHRPFLLPLPALAVRMLFGEMGRELLLGGAFVEPARLLQHGFHFRFPTLRSALRFELDQ